ncbi:MAG: PQQ-binding-like beta-propeller repeat protein [Verrucomicrobiae bacterium]|nr:PQQ-binding-like beta-propeller repeat protein [Verrucomicrobiae bacterium]
MKSLPLLAAAALGAAALDAATGAALNNWPAWRGPLANGVSPTAQPPVDWSEDRNVRWKTAIPGRGTSTPVIWDDLVFVLTAIPQGTTGAAPSAAPAAATEPPSDPPRGPRGPGGRGGPGGGMTEAPTVPQQFTVLAYERATGKPRWERGVRTQLPHEGHHRDHGFASASPVTDGEVLVASFGSFGIYAMDFKGQVLWEKDLGDMRTRNSFGEGSSPAMHGDIVVVLWDHEGDDFIVALDRKSGRELWRQERDEPTGWSTPLIIQHAGKPQVVVNGTQKVRAYDLETGRLLWEVGGQTVNAIPSPLPFGDRVIVMSGFRGSALQVIRLGGSGDLEGSDAIVWTHNRNTPYVPSPMLYGNHLYFFSGNNAMLSIFDATTGKAGVEAERLDGLQGVYASPVGAADRVYLLGRDGGALVIRNGLALEILATNRLDDGFDASPALAGTDLFLRGREHLYCISESK